MYKLKSLSKCEAIESIFVLVANASYRKNENLNCPPVSHFKFDLNDICGWKNVHVHNKIDVWDINQDRWIEDQTLIVEHTVMKTVLGGKSDATRYI